MVWRKCEMNYLVFEFSNFKLITDNISLPNLFSAPLAALYVTMRQNMCLDFHSVPQCCESLQPNQYKSHKNYHVLEQRCRASSLSRIMEIILLMMVFCWKIRKMVFCWKIRTRIGANTFQSEMIEDPDKMKLFDPVWISFFQIYWIRFNFTGKILFLPTQESKKHNLGTLLNCFVEHFSLFHEALKR